MSDPVPDSKPLEVRALKAMERDAAFTSVLLVRKVAAKTAKNDNTYLAVELGDKTGSFHFTCFGDNPGFDFFQAIKEGSAVRIEGRIDFYQSRLSPKISKAEELSDAQLAEPGLIENLVETAPEDPVRLWKELEGRISSIGHAELRATVQAVFDDIGGVFQTAPAAVAMHHAYRHGLLEHTCHMARACQALAPLYPEVDADLAMAGILLHDTGKTIEYEGGLVTQRSRRGLLQGHVVLGYQIVRKAALKAKLDADRLERLEHIILSHQGEPAWGAAVYAATPEAVFVSMIDNLDAKMGMVQRALRQAVAGDEFSERLPGLNTSLLTTKPPERI
jgi:3'-5' exoribonuclease